MLTVRLVSCWKEMVVTVTKLSSSLLLACGHQHLKIAKLKREKLNIQNENWIVLWKYLPTGRGWRLRVLGL